MRHRDVLTILVGLALIVVVATMLDNDHYNPSSAWLNKYSHVPKGWPKGCWYEVNKTQPHGVEMICMPTVPKGYNRVDIPRCKDKSSVLVGDGQWDGYVWENYHCGPSRNDIEAKPTMVRVGK